MNIEFFVSKGEEVDFSDKSFDVITACQCIWYIDADKAAPRFARILTSQGKSLILYMGWLPCEDPVACRSEELILKYNPTWTGCGDTVHPVWVPDQYLEYFDLVSQNEFRVDVPFSREGWHGRMRACRGVGASMAPEALALWDKEHMEMLKTNAHERFTVKHYVSIAELQVK